MMLRKQNRHFGIAVTLLIGFGLLLSTLAMAPNQATATPTLESTVTNTEPPTSTPTATLTPTFTPTYSIPEPLQTEFANVNEKLDGLAQNPISTHANNILDNLTSSGILWILGLLVAFFGLAKEGAQFKNNQDKSAGKLPNRTLVNLEIAFRNILKFSTWFLLGLLLILAVHYLGQPMGQSSNQIELTNISNKLDEIQNQIRSSSIATTIITPTRSPTEVQSSSSQLNGSTPDQDSAENNVILLLTAEVMGLGLLAFFVYFSSKLAKYQTEIYEVNVSKVNLREIGTSLLPAGLVVFALFLLPSPVDGILMPLLVPFLIFGFFDVIRIHPSLYLKNLVVNHYSKIIYIAQFGAWYSFLSILKNYANPFFGIYMSAWQKVIGEITTPIGEQWNGLFYRLPQLILDFAPLLLAMGLAIRPWYRIKKQSETNQIMKIQESIKQDDIISSFGK